MKLKSTVYTALLCALSMGLVPKEALAQNNNPTYKSLYNPTYNFDFLTMPGQSCTSLQLIASIGPYRSEEASDFQKGSLRYIEFNQRRLIFVTPLDQLINDAGAFTTTSEPGARLKILAGTQNEAYLSGAAYAKQYSVSHSSELSMTHWENVLASGSGGRLHSYITRYKPYARSMPGLTNPSALENYLELPMDITMNTEGVNNAVDFKYRVMRLRFPSNSNVITERIQGSSVVPYLKSGSGPAYVYSYYPSVTSSRPTECKAVTGSTRYDVVVALVRDPDHNFLFGMVGDGSTTTAGGSLNTLDLIYSPKIKNEPNANQNWYLNQAMRRLTKTFQANASGDMLQTASLSLRFATVDVPNTTSAALVCRQKVGQMVSDLGCAYTQTGQATNPLPGFTLNQDVMDRPLARVFMTNRGGGDAARTVNPNFWGFESFLNQGLKATDGDNNASHYPLYKTNGGSLELNADADPDHAGRTIKERFWDAMDAEADRLIALYTDATTNSQPYRKPHTVIIWDLEGVYRTAQGDGNDYTGDLAELPNLAPEMLITRSVGGVPTTAIANFLHKLEAAGIKLGATLRPDKTAYTSTPPGGDVLPVRSTIAREAVSIDATPGSGDQTNLALVHSNFISQMVSRIQYHYDYDDYHITTFYVDVNKIGGYYVFGEWYHEIMAALPQTLRDKVVLIPEYVKDDLSLSSVSPYCVVKPDAGNYYNRNLDVFAGVYPNGRNTVFGGSDMNSTSIASYGEKDAMKTLITTKNLAAGFNYSRTGYEDNTALTDYLYQSLGTLTSISPTCSPSTYPDMPTTLTAAYINYTNGNFVLATAGAENPISYVDANDGNAVKPTVFTVNVTQSSNAWGSLSYEWESSSTSSGSWTKYSDGALLVTRTPGYYRLRAWDLRNKAATAILSPAYPIGVSPDNFLPISGTNVTVGCNDVIYTDPQGPNADYNNAATGQNIFLTQTLTPPTGKRLTFTYLDGDIANDGTDDLWFYDADCYTGCGGSPIWNYKASGWVPFFISSLPTSGKMTVRFNANSTLNGRGWKYRIGCLDAAAPYIKSFAVKEGPEGIYVTLTGINFSSTTRVFFGGAESSPVSYNSSNNTLLAKVPDLGTDAAPCYIKALNTDGLFSLSADQFKPSDTLLFYVGKSELCHAVFTDPEGPNAPYLLNRYWVHTIYPATGNTGTVQVSFTDVNLTQASGQTSDQLYVYNSDAVGTNLYAILGSGTTTVSETNPLTYTAVKGTGNTPGALTFRFYANATSHTPGRGWKANVTCTSGVRQGNETAYNGLNSLTVYPNPAQDVLNVEYEGQEDLPYNVFDGLGKRILSGSLAPGKSNRILTGKLAKGLYLLKTAKSTMQFEVE